ARVSGVSLRPCEGKRAPFDRPGRGRGVMKTHRTLTLGILVVAVAVVSFGCASAAPGTVVPIKQADLPSLAGVWSGFAYAGATGYPGELTLRPDGSFNNEVGAFTSTGVFQLQNGSLVSNP